MENLELRELILNLENKLVINSIHTCHICGSMLELSHKTDFVSLRVIESSKCPKCGIALKNKTHILH